MKPRPMIPVLALFGIFQATAAAENRPSVLDNYQIRYEEKLDLIRQPLTKLGDRYREALVKLQDDLQEKADLDGLLALRSELKRFDELKLPPAENSALGSIARLQKIYQAGYDEKFPAIEKQLIPAETAYREKLEGMMRKLTTTGEVDLAVKVRSALEKLGPARSTSETTLETELILHFRFQVNSGEGEV